MNDLRQLPSVDQLMNTEMVAEYVSVYGRSLTINSIRDVLDQVRTNHKSGQSIPAEEDLVRLVEVEIKARINPTLQPVINATGVILHTNLGRSPLSRSAIRAMDAVASGYSTLEYDLVNGRRGSRNIHAEEYLMQLTGAEAAFVVNNNAAAVLLILSALSKRRKVVIPRSQLVEIGGGFRVPDVMNQSGAKLFEIGTTNRVHLHDYQKAIQEESIKLIMRAHRSNFQILGFTSEPSLKEIVEIAHQAGIPVMDDLGSGALLDTAEFGLGHEPTVQESLDAGVDLVCFSGDKLLGGPQAGIILGNPKLVDRLKKHPLARAIRADKLCLAALAATLLHYLKSEALSEIPVWGMISQSPEEIHSRADKWVKYLGKGEIIAGKSTVGGGSLPGETLATWLVAINHLHPNQLQTQLRRSQPPIITRIDENHLVLDPRTVLASQEEIFLQNLGYVLND